MVAWEQPPVVCDVSAVINPDIGTVDALARLALTARRYGCQLQLQDASRELRELLDLAGLGDAVLGSTALRLEPWGQPEHREQAGRVEEEVESDDPTA